ncbi:hypothetical protein MA9V2_120 [Chryseobacterium phage MA9V-2]|nr:hypothetical protein MA9V2_120 [Chryseobacterium phage MA9V-2]
MATTITTNGLDLLTMPELFRPDVPNLNDTNQITFKFLIDASFPEKSFVARKSYYPNGYVNPNTGKNYQKQCFGWILIVADDKNPDNVGKVKPLHIYQNLIDIVFKPMENINHYIGLRSHNVTITYHYNPEARRILTIPEVSAELSYLDMPGFNFDDYEKPTTMEQLRAKNVIAKSQMYFDIKQLEQDFYS